MEKRYQKEIQQKTRDISQLCGVKYYEMADGVSRGVMAISDRDVPMIEFDKIEIGMGNSSEKVRKASNYVTSNNNRDGAYSALKEMVFKNA